MFKVTRGRSWIIAVIVVFAAFLPLTASADGIGGDPPIGAPESPNTTEEYSTLEIIAYSIYVAMI